MDNETCKIYIQRIDLYKVKDQLIFYAINDYSSHNKVEINIDGDVDLKLQMENHAKNRIENNKPLKIMTHMAASVKIVKKKDANSFKYELIQINKGFQKSFIKINSFVEYSNHILKNFINNENEHDLNLKLLLKNEEALKHALRAASRVVNALTSNRGTVYDDTVKMKNFVDDIVSLIKDEFININQELPYNNINPIYNKDYTYKQACINFPNEKDLIVAYNRIVNRLDKSNINKEYINKIGLDKKIAS